MSARRPCQGKLRDARAMGVPKVSVNPSGGDLRHERAHAEVRGVLTAVSTISTRNSETDLNEASSAPLMLKTLIVLVYMCVIHNVRFLSHRRV